MPSKALIGASAALGVLFALLVGVAVEATTDNAAASTDPATGPIGDSLRPGSVPAPYVLWIEKAAGACPGLPAPVLAAQLHQESGFQPNAVSNAGAEGIAQFMPGTWTAWATDADGDGTASPYDPADAITAQGHLMCALLHKGQHSGYVDPPIEQALAGYNAGWARVVQYEGVPPESFAGGQTYDYVHSIMVAAHTYAAAVSPAGSEVALPTDFTLPGSTPPPVRTAIEWALRQRGAPYREGGTCTDARGTDPTRWCDCSSLVQQAYRAAGITLPRTSYDQVHVGQAVTADNPLPGDLIFTPGTNGSAGAPGHVALYIGNGLLIEAPHAGAPIRVIPYTSVRDAPAEQNRVVAVRRIVPQ